MDFTNADTDEKPVYEVTINYAFYSGKYQVTETMWTQTQWQTV